MNVEQTLLNLNKTVIHIAHNYNEELKNLYDEIIELWVKELYGDIFICWYWWYKFQMKFIINIKYMYII